jgi:hypothetical protein
MIVRYLDRAKTKHLRRLARYLGVRRWSRLRRGELIEELKWKLELEEMF